MPSILVPPVAATVFTVGGYVIMKMEQYAEAIGDWLFTVFILAAFATGALVLERTIAQHRPHQKIESHGPQGQQATAFMPMS